jgi:hypothetical protein
VGLRLVEDAPPKADVERPPFVLRWVWYFGPLLVAAAMTGMFFAARSAGAPQKRAAGTPGLEVYAERAGHTYRVAPGSRLHHGQRLKLVLVPAGAALGETDVRVAVDDALDVAGPGPLHLVALLSSRPLAAATVQIALARRPGDEALAVPAVRVSFDAEVE